VKPGAETIRDVIARYVEKCATSEGKSVLLIWSIDREGNFVPQDEGLRLHQDSVEFIDTDGTQTCLPFSRIARIEIDEDDTQPILPTTRIEIGDDSGKVVQFPKKREH
jgi:hypothetical protein